MYPDTLEGFFSQIDNLYETFKTNHTEHTTKGNNAAGGRARKALGEIKKLITDYRKKSVEHKKEEPTA